MTNDVLLALAESKRTQRRARRLNALTELKQAKELVIAANARLSAAVEIADRFKLLAPGEDECEHEHYLSNKTASEPWSRPIGTGTTCTTAAVDLVRKEELSSKDLAARIANALLKKEDSTNE